MKSCKEKSGITLIALVITIIVLLILAGVSLSLVVGQTGVLNKAQKAVENSEMARIEELRQLTIGKAAMNLERTIYESDGKTAIVPAGFAVSENEREQSIDNGLVVIDKYGDEFVWIPVISDSSYVKKSGARNCNISVYDETQHGRDVVALDISGDDYGENSWINSLEKESATVNTAKGFYVSRYEIGIDNIERSAGTQTDIRTNDTKYYSQRGKEPVRAIPQIEALNIANNWKKGVDLQSGLITGTEWDTMCNFIGWSKCDEDCTSWGNYANIDSKEFADGEVFHSKFAKDNGILLWTNRAIRKGKSNIEAEKDKTDRVIFETGSFINGNGGNTITKNIYDVAGNVWEWTTETINRYASDRVFRGGSCNGTGDDFIATYRYAYSMNNSSWCTGFRVVLYVK